MTPLYAIKVSDGRRTEIMRDADWRCEVDGHGARASYVAIWDGLIVASCGTCATPRHASTV